MPLYLNVRAFLPPSSVTNPYSTIVHSKRPRLLQKRSCGASVTQARMGGPLGAPSECAKLHVCTITNNIGVYTIF